MDEDNEPWIWLPHEERMKYQRELNAMLSRALAALHEFREEGGKPWAEVKRELRLSPTKPE